MGNAMNLRPAHARATVKLALEHRELWRQARLSGEYAAMEQTQREYFAIRTMAQKACDLADIQLPPELNCQSPTI